MCIKGGLVLKKARAFSDTLDSMTEAEMLERLTRVEADAKHALELGKKNTELIIENREKITAADDRARSAEHRILKVEGKVDTVLDRLARLGKSQATNNINTEQIRKYTRKVFYALITAICAGVANKIFI